MEDRVKETVEQVRYEERVDEEATQPATQLVIDPRRLGHHNSGLDDNELTDIICILHPASMTAYRAMDAIMEDAPQHTISTGGVPMRIRASSPLAWADDGPGSFELAAQGIVTRDIALRLSAELKTTLSGFQFGRSPQRCDFLLGKGNADGVKRISNIHFRIYVNEHGIIMLEDQSTNGTVVDNVMLRSKDKENKQYRHMLEQGSIISLLMTPPDEDIKFVVRIPAREGYYEDEYHRNLQEYFARLRALRAARDAQKAITARQTPGGENPTAAGPPDIFAPPSLQPQSTASTLDSRRHVREWKGGETYKKVGQIGKGAFATVYMITSRFDGTPFAAKELEKRRFMKNGILDQKVDMEMNIMRKIKHPNIVQYIEHIDWHEYLYLIMEYVPQGDLGNLVSDRGQLPEPMVRSIADQMLSALDYLHQMNITHRDVKPDNILIQNKDPIQVKLTDFGLSKVVDNEDTFMHTFCGTLLYCAPEVYSEYREYDKESGMRTRRGKGKENLPPQRYGHGVDVWSLGGVLFYALSGTPPYPAKSGTSYQELLNDIMTKALDIRPLQYAGVSENAIRSVKNMLTIRPENRPTITTLHASSWFTGKSSAGGLEDDEEDDDVDMVGETPHGNLEEGASQLSLKQKEMLNSQIDSYDDDDLEIDTDEVELIRATASQLEVPDSQSGISESFSFMRNPPDKNNGRLFGEVNASVLGSSGVIPRSHLNLPLSQSFQSVGNYDGNATSTSSNPNIPNTEQRHLYEAPRTENQHVAENGRSETTPSTEEIPTSSTVPSYTSQGPIKAPSLMGAESMVGNLQMNSPSPGAMSPQMPTLSALVVTPLNESGRRPREDETLQDSRPNPKRVKSGRQIDVKLSKTIFWSKDKSTWHGNYPDLTLSEYNDLEAKAKARGETFTHGQKIFDDLIANYIQTAPASVNEIPRAESEPTIVQGRRSLLKRDDRVMEDTLRQDAILPSTSHRNLDTMTGLDTRFAEVNPVVPISDTALPEHVAASQSHTAASMNNLSDEPPKAILARLTPYADSKLPVTIECTETLTTWGRSHDNSHQYSDRADVRVPKHAFKIILANPHSEIQPESQSSLGFYICTKATWGISVNGIKILSVPPQHFATPAKIWGELKTGDIVCIWATLNNSPVEHISFVFEAFVGSSQESRKNPKDFRTVTDEAVIKELDGFGR